jgi:hypothetical protein
MDARRAATFLEQANFHQERAWTARSGAPARCTRSGSRLYLDGYAVGCRAVQGVRFVPPTMPDTQAVPAGGVRRLLASRDGTLWIVRRAASVSRLKRVRMTFHGARMVFRCSTLWRSREAARGVLRRLILALKETDNRQWLIARLGYRLPARVSQAFVVSLPA